jgi:leucyl aminopeptidase (aminopeptidase T)
MGWAELIRCMNTVAVQCGNVKAGEKAAVLTDLRQSPEITDSLMGVLHALDLDVATITLTPREGKQGSLPEPVLDCLKGMDIVFLCSITRFPRPQMEAIYQAGKARVLQLFGIDMDQMLRTVSIDYNSLSQRLNKMVNLVTPGKTLILGSPGGGHLEMSIEGRSGQFVDGIVRGAGQINYIPAGVFAVTAVETTIRGNFFINGSIHGIGKVSQPVELWVDRGRITEIRGGDEASRLKAKLDAADANAFCIGELGFGANPNARLMGTGEDERINGGIHIGIGHNIHLGGTVQSSSHIDVNTTGGDFIVDGTDLIRGGEIRM